MDRLFNHVGVLVRRDFAHSSFLVVRPFSLGTIYFMNG
jgi:hypothetical protein